MSSYTVIVLYIVHHHQSKCVQKPSIFVFSFQWYVDIYIYIHVFITVLSWAMSVKMTEMADIFCVLCVRVFVSVDFSECFRFFSKYFEDMFVL